MGCVLEREYRFEAAHSLPKVPESHPCRRVHGHSYHVTVVISGRIDETLGWVVDFSDIDKVVRPLMAELDHRSLNDIPGLENPTSEILAMWLWQRLAPRFDKLCEVRVSETPTSRCIYRGP
jgi:6-pyruvoyltetrahydropterin/6-carboxytetrahydropterin synthase